MYIIKPEIHSSSSDLTSRYQILLVISVELRRYRPLPVISVFCIGKYKTLPVISSLVEIQVTPCHLSNNDFPRSPQVVEYAGAVVVLRSVAFMTCVQFPSLRPSSPEDLEASRTLRRIMKT